MLTSSSSYRMAINRAHRPMWTLWFVPSFPTQPRNLSCMQRFAGTCGMGLVALRTRHVRAQTRTRKFAAEIIPEIIKMQLCSILAATLCTAGGAYKMVPQRHERQGHRMSKPIDGLCHTTLTCCCVMTAISMSRFAPPYQIAKKNRQLILSLSLAEPTVSRGHRRL